MNHLARANDHYEISFDCYRDDQDRLGDRHLKIAKFHAQMAIAEREENLGYEIRTTREKLCLSLDAIAEQLEKMNHPLCALSDITITP